MNLIEEAAKRLRQLEQAGIATGPAAAPKKRPAEACPADRRKLDLARLQAAGFITPALEDSRLLHEFRVVKRPLVQHALGKGAAPAANRNLVMVTSALPGEGKTFVALNLAMSLAMEVDCRVLLVDADVVSPSLPRVLGIEPAKGLMDLLNQGDSGPEQMLLGTNVERLTLLLAGTPHASASELLASEAMTRLLADIASRYPERIVVFDSPPLLATTESRVLATRMGQVVVVVDERTTTATRMGQVVVVVEAERTTHAALESALSTLADCPAVYTLLNKTPESKVASYYGGYAYGH